MNIDPNDTPDVNADLGLSQAEQDALAIDLAPAAEATPAATPEPVAAAPEPAAATVDPNTAALTAAAEKLASAAESLAARAEPAPTPTPEAVAAASRDFDAELSALEQQFDDGEVDQAEYRRRERSILREQAQADAQAAITASTEQQRQQAQQQAEQDAEAAWHGAQQRFFADPGNAAFVADPIKAAGFKAAVDVVFAETKGQISFDDLLVKAREKLTGVPAVDPNEAINKAKFERQQQAGAPAQTLRDVPSAADNDNGPGATLDNLPISELEDKLALMSEADRARYRESAPGGYHDNPRAA